MSRRLRSPLVEGSSPSVGALPLERLADVLEALEQIRLYLPVYRVIKAKTGSKQQALDAIKFLAQFDDEYKGDPL